jgi:carbon-monoxide dehydrogenase large subunit
MAKDFGIGAEAKRTEDIRYLTGAGNYTHDIDVHGQAYAVFVRSNMAHARIKSVGVAAAAGMPGVLAVFTGEDFKDVGGNPAGWLINSRNGEPMREPKRPVLAHGKVRHVGDAYAAVIAQTYMEAKDAAQAVADASEFEELPAIIDMAQALADNTNRVHDEIADLLQQLRRLQDLQVAIEVRFIRLNDTFFERIGVNLGAGLVGLFCGPCNSGKRRRLPGGADGNFVVGFRFRKPCDSISLVPMRIKDRL